MPDITIDTTDAQYIQLYNGLATLRTVLTPRVKVLAELPRNKQRLWLQRDPLMRRFAKMVRDFNEAADWDEPDD